MSAGADRSPAELERIARARGEPDGQRWNAIWALTLGNADRVLPLAPLIADETEPDLVRGAVALGLEYVDDQRAAAVLRASLASDFPEYVRCMAASALGFHPSSADAIGDLVATLLDTAGASQVRGHAAEALGHWFQFHRAAVPAEVNKALRASVLDRDEIVRYEAVWALGRIGRVKDVALLERVLAAEEARETPKAEIVTEAKASIRDLSSRRRPRRP